MDRLHDGQKTVNHAVEAIVAEAAVPRLWVDRYPEAGEPLAIRKRLSTDPPPFAGISRELDRLVWGPVPDKPGQDC